MIIDCTLVAKSSDHFKGQSETGSVLRQAGFDEIRWICSQGPAWHTWRVTCTAEDAVLLSLKSVKVSFDYNRVLEEERAELEKDLVEIRKKISEINRVLTPKKVIAV